MKRRGPVQAARKPAAPARVRAVVKDVPAVPSIVRPDKPWKGKPKSRFLPLARELERKATRGVRFTTRYRDPKSGRLARFRPGKKLRVEIWLSKTLQFPGQKTRVKTARVKDLGLRRAKRPLSQQALARRVVKDIVTRKGVRARVELTQVAGEWIVRISYPKAKGGAKG